MESSPRPEPERCDLGGVEERPAAGGPQAAGLSLAPGAVRLALAAEFLLALVASLTLWSQAGGQYHLDLMPWYWKLGLSCGFSYAAVRATASAMRHENAWNAATLGWLALALAIGLLAGMVTYYYHVNEPAEEEP